MIQLSYDDFEEKIQQLYTKITEDGYNPNVIVGITRGGNIPATRLSYMFDVKEYSLTITKDGNERVLESEITADLTGKNVLLVEDVLETGDSLWVGEKYLENEKGAIVKTAALYITSKTTKKPDFYLKEIKEVPEWDGSDPNKKHSIM
ncbi:MAG: hypothetical protein KAI53_02740 [Candidatus Aenigmarchaeota archaeon]|nr:hypothetical protein [Candidatus Aenigmarchaeota archaeon]